jgi:hypothetical protein
MAAFIERTVGIPFSVIFNMEFPEIDEEQWTKLAVPSRQNSPIVFRRCVFLSEIAGRIGNKPVRQSHIISMTLKLDNGRKVTHRQGSINQPAMKKNADVSEQSKADDLLFCQLFKFERPVKLNDPPKAGDSYLPCGPERHFLMVRLSCVSLSEGNPPGTAMVAKCQ